MKNAYSRLVAQAFSWKVDEVDYAPMQELTELLAADNTEAMAATRDYLLSVSEPVRMGSPSRLEVWEAVVRYVVGVDPVPAVWLRQFHTTYHWGLTSLYGVSFANLYQRLYPCPSDA